MTIAVMPQQQNQGLDLLKILLALYAQTQGTEATKGAAGREIAKEAGTPQGIQDADVAKFAEGLGMTPEAFRGTAKKTVQPSMQEELIGQQEIASTTPRFSTDAKIIPPKTISTGVNIGEPRISYSLKSGAERLGEARGEELKAQTANIVPAEEAKVLAEEKTFSRKEALKTKGAKSELARKTEMLKPETDYETSKFETQTALRGMINKETIKQEADKVKALYEADPVKKATKGLYDAHAEYYATRAELDRVITKDERIANLFNRTLKAKDDHFKSIENTYEGILYETVKDDKGNIIRRSPLKQHYKSEGGRNSIMAKYEVLKKSGVKYEVIDKPTFFEVGKEGISPGGRTIEVMLIRPTEQDIKDEMALDLSKSEKATYSKKARTTEKDLLPENATKGIMHSPRGIIYKGAEKVGETVAFPGLPPAVLVETPVKVKSKETGNTTYKYKVRFPDGTIEDYIVH